MKNKTEFSLVSGPLTNKCLVAVPNMTDESFENSVIYICSNSDKTGTIGLVLSKKTPLFLESLFTQVGIKSDQSALLNKDIVLWGGPVENARGFVLHSNDFSGFETTHVSEKINLTASIDVLAKMANNEGPKDALVFLGCSSWDAGQLELEIVGNSWLVMDANEDFLFHCAADKKWKKAFSLMGIDPALFSSEQGSV